MKKVISRALATSMLVSVFLTDAYSATVDVTINVTGRTCNFDKTTDTVTLDTVRVEDFINSKKIIGIKDVPVGIKCSSDVDTVKIKVSGEPAVDNNGASHPDYFRNTGSAKNIGLAFMDISGNPLSAGAGAGENSVAVRLDNGGVASYTFKAGYTALVPAARNGGQYISGGDLQSSVNLTFDYD